MAPTPICTIDFIEVRRDSGAADMKAQAELLLALVPYVEDFMGDLFKIADEVRRLQVRHDELAPLYAVKRSFVQRRATKGKGCRRCRQDRRPSDCAAAGFSVRRAIDGTGICPSRRRMARNRSRNTAPRSSWQPHTRRGRRWLRPDSVGTADEILFKLPQKIDRMNSIPLQPVIKDGVTVLKGSGDRQRHRDGFRLTDGGASFAHALDQASYCIRCHNQGKDSCSQLSNRKTGFYEHDVFGVELLGRPLEERISKRIWRERRATRSPRRNRRGRQSLMCRNGSSHLQRLHESLHLSEAGAGRYSAGRDTHAQGGSCVGGPRFTRCSRGGFRSISPDPFQSLQRAARFLLLDWDRLVLPSLIICSTTATRTWVSMASKSSRLRPTCRASIFPAADRRSGRFAMLAKFTRSSIDGRWRASAVSPRTVSPCGGTRTISRSLGCRWSAGRISRCMVACGLVAR